MRRERGKASWHKQHGDEHGDAADDAGGRANKADDAGTTATAARGLKFR